MSQTFKIYFTTKRGNQASLLIKAFDFKMAGEVAADLCRLNGFSLNRIETWYV